jgi:hypothetical protein
MPTTTHTKQERTMASKRGLVSWDTPLHTHHTVDTEAILAMAERELERLVPMYRTFPETQPDTDIHVANINRALGRLQGMAARLQALRPTARLEVEHSIALRLLHRGLGDVGKAIEYLKGFHPQANPVDMFGTELGCDFSRVQWAQTVDGGYSEVLMTACIDLREAVYQRANDLRELDTMDDTNTLDFTFQDYCDQACEQVLEDAGVDMD